jgi:hypothetical protein
MLQNLAQHDMTEYVSIRLLVEGVTRVAVRAPLKKNNLPTCAHLYDVKKNNKQREKGKL